MSDRKSTPTPFILIGAALGAAAFSVLAGTLNWEMNSRFADLVYTVIFSALVYGGARLGAWLYDLGAASAPSR